jgi:L-malate glycosyltransferase
MKILHTVEFYHPSVGGMQEVVKQISERLASLGHDVTVATTNLPDRTEQIVNDVKVVGFSISGNLVRGLSGDVESYRKFLLHSDFDVITNFAAQQWATDVMITMLDHIRAKKVFVPTGFSGLYKRRYRGYFASMKDWMRQYDMNIFLSDTYRDMAFAREHGIEKRAVISNGASEDEFIQGIDLDIRTKLKIPKDQFIVLHVGSHTGLKGHRESFKIFGNARIRNATLLIVANNVDTVCGRECRTREFIFNRLPKNRTAGKQVIVASLRRPETLAAYQAADLFLFPSNIECSPLVLFECMASRTPFLTSNAGNAAEIVEWSKGGMMMPSRTTSRGYSKALTTGSARLLEELYESPQIRKSMQESGFRVWQERFTWGKIAGEYETLYRTLVKRAV